MKKASRSKRTLALLTAILLVISCGFAVCASTVVDVFTGDSASSLGLATVKLSCFGGGDVEYDVGGDIGFTSSSYESASVPIGASVTATAVPTAENPFLYWIDVFANRVYSFEEQITFTAASRVHFKAMFSNADETEHVVQYLNYGGNPLLSTSLLERGVRPVAPTGPVLPGFKFKNWSVLSDTIATMDENVIVTPKYTVNDESYTVSITNDAYVSGAGTYTNFQTVNLQAEEKNGEGKTFSYWKTSDDEIVSYDRNYSFRINYDVTLTAVYGESVTQQPVIRTTKIVRDASSKQITVYAERSVPEGYTVISHGMLMTVNKTYSDAKMLVGRASDSTTAQLRKVYGTSNENCGTFSLAKTSVTDSTTVVSRPFVICRDASGSTVIAYGNVMRTTLAG